MLSALEVSLGSGKVRYWCIYFPHPFHQEKKKYYFNMINAIFTVFIYHQYFIKSLVIHDLHYRITEKFLWNGSPEIIRSNCS